MATLASMVRASTLDLPIWDVDFAGILCIVYITLC
jgi:hypothetical protein